MAFASSTADQASSGNGRFRLSETPIPPSLRFLMDSIKSINQHPLTFDNYLQWSSQILNIVDANSMSSYLDINLLPPPEYLADSPETVNPDFTMWKFVDKNLAAAIYSTISSSLLPYAVGFPSTAHLWDSLAKRFQANTRSRSLQLKTELSQLSMKHQTMQAYLQSIKVIVDLLQAISSPLPQDEIVLYTLKGLPPSYYSFKTSIRTRPGDLPMDEFYAMLCSEEAHLAAEAAQNSVPD